jgi:hypothetical protein
VAGLLARSGHWLFGDAIMITPRDILVGIVAPGFIALILFIAAWRPWKRKMPVHNGYWAAPLAAGLAVVIAFATISMHVIVPGLDKAESSVPWPKVPPTDAKQWLLLLSLPLGLVGFTQAILKLKWWLASPLALAAMVGFLYPLLPRQEWHELGVAAAITWGVWVLTELLSTQKMGATLPLVFWLTATGAAIVIIAGHSQKVGQYAVSLAAVAGAAVVVALVTRHTFTLAQGGAFVFITLLAGLLATAHFYADVTMFGAIGVLTIPVASSAGSLPVIRKKSPAVRTTTSLLASLVWFGVVVTPSLIELIKIAKREATGGSSYDSW